MKPFRVKNSANSAWRENVSLFVKAVSVSDARIVQGSFNLVIICFKTDVSPVSCLIHLKKVSKRVVST